MSKVLHGVVYGKTIEVTEDLEMTDGQAVELIVTPADANASTAGANGPRTSAKKLSGPPPGWKPGSKETAAGMMASDWTEDDDRILEEIHQEREKRPGLRP